MQARRTIRTVKLRAKLIAAFLLLAVLPLGGLTLYSYSSSRRALRQAVQQEASRLTAQMEERMDTLAGELDRRVAEVGRLPLARQLLGPRSEEWQSRLGSLYEDVVEELGEAADLLESLELEHSVHAAASPAGHPPGGPGSVVIRLPEVLPPEESGPRPAPRVRVEPLAGDRLVIRRELERAHREARLAVEEAVGSSALAGRELPPPPAPQPPQAGAPDAPPAPAWNRRFGSEVAADGRVIGRLSAKVDSARLLGRVLRSQVAASDEVPFVVDREGNLYTPNPEHRKLLARLQLADRLKNHSDTTPVLEEWVVALRPQQSSGLTFGIARPIGEGLREIERSTVRNLGLGLGMIVLAMLGILPLSRYMTRNLTALEQGAERLAAGDLQARVSVRSRDEFGRLSETFNHMAGQLERNQRELVERERLRKELEMCRQIQEELLPSEPLSLPFGEIRGVSIPAREVGGDFFDYFTLPSGYVAILIGDVSGKGVAAALLMANLQATLRARLPLESDLEALAAALDREIARQTPAETFVTLFMGRLSADGRRLEWVSAGHNPQFLIRRDGRLRRLAAGGRPLGLLPGGPYECESDEVEAKDILFLYTDGLVEAEDPADEQFGLERLERVLGEAAVKGNGDLLAAVEDAVARHRAGREAGDDATLMVLRLS